MQHFTGPRSLEEIKRVNKFGPGFGSGCPVTGNIFKRLALIAVAAALWAGPSHAQTVTEFRALEYGTVAGSGESAGSVTISTSGSVTTSGAAVNLGGTFVQAQYKVTGPKNANVILSLPSTATVSAGGSTATLHSFVANPAAGVPQSLGSNGRLTYHVGATLDLSAGQAAGSYSGTFSVFVDPG